MEKFCIKDVIDFWALCIALAGIAFVLLTSLRFLHRCIIKQIECKKTFAQVMDKSSKETGSLVPEEHISHEPGQSAEIIRGIVSPP